jgi:heme A synthase
MSPPERRLRLAAGLGLGLLLVVVVAAAGIRLEIAPGVLRPIHRAAASLEVIVVLWLGWVAWRARASRPGVWRASLVAIGLTAFLAAVGIAAGQNPPPAGAAANLLGGLALAAVFAWLLGRINEGSRAIGLVLAFIVGVLLAIQLLLGARLAIVERFAVALPVHGLLAMVLAALLAWLGLARVPGRAGKALFALALAAPVAGFTSLHYEWSAGAALAHSAAAALLLASTAYALGRGA